MRRFAFALGMAVAACGGGRPAPAPQAVAPDRASGTPATRVTHPEPFLPPEVARLAGLLPLRSLGIEQFRTAHPEADGRGVLIAILDGGLDLGVPGLQRTTTGDPKVVDVRDFSGEGRIRLTAVTADGDTATIGGRTLAGLGRLRRLTRGPLWVGVFAERPLGRPPAADVNGDGDADDVFPLAVARASDGWVLMTDTDGDGSLVGERELRDYAVNRDTFSYGPLTVAVNFADGPDGAPQLDLFFDTSGHGTHVAGIAAGHRLFGLPGFHGAAPGAQVLGLKIANNARGGISVPGSMYRAIEYAAATAERLGRPLILNLSYGVGNEREGGAVIDSLVSAFALAHPEAVLVISAGNDGPGLSTVGFPGSAEFAISVCALFPGVFAEPPTPGMRPRADVMGWWSSRGGEVQKPDLCAPGVAFSNVPPWQVGEEVSGGTSMAAPQVSGAAALLQSALLGRGAPSARAVDVKAALQATSRPVEGATVLDVGTGTPDVEEAFRWLLAGHQPGRFRVRALTDGGNTSRASAAFRREGLVVGDTIQRFEVASVSGQPSAEVLLRPDAAWMRVPDRAAFAGAPVTIPVTYDAAQMREPGLYVGTVWARSATDPMAGALFGLTSTIVVPYDLAQGRVEWQQRVPAGQDARIFVAVPEGAGGLRVGAASRPGQSASVALFEPSGRPQRDGLAIELGDGTWQESVDVRGEDAMPGVWEIVIVAPPVASATVAVTLEAPPVRFEDVPGGVELVNTGARPVTVRLEASALGAAGEFPVDGHLDPVLRSLAVPVWANAMDVEVRFDAARWGEFTDFGASVFDRDGRLLGSEPLNYATGRQSVTLEGGTDSVRIELFPAQARPETAASWTCTLTTAFRGEAIPVPVLGGSADTTFVLEPGGRRRLAPERAPFGVPDAMRLLLDLRATAGGIPAIRRALLPVPPPAPVATEAG